MIVGGIHPVEKEELECEDVLVVGGIKAEKASNISHTMFRNIEDILSEGGEARTEDVVLDSINCRRAAAKDAPRTISPLKAPIRAPLVKGSLDMSKYHTRLNIARERTIRLKNPRDQTLKIAQAQKISRGDWRTRTTDQND